MNNNITVEYDGSFPNLCRGHLIVRINGKVYDFGKYCLASGGSVSFDSNWQEIVTSGPWSIFEWPVEFPEEYKADVIAAVNNKIPNGCCGGCV